MRVEQSVTDLSWHTVQRANAEHVNINTQHHRLHPRSSKTLGRSKTLVCFFKYCPFNRKERHPFFKKMSPSFPSDFHVAPFSFRLFYLGIWDRFSIKTRRLFCTSPIKASFSLSLDAKPVDILLLKPKQVGKNINTFMHSQRKTPWWSRHSFWKVRLTFLQKHQI